MARKPKALKIAVYLRCSTEEQADREYSTIDAQRDKTKAFAHGCVAVANAGADLSSFFPAAVAKRFAGLPAEFAGEFSDPGKTGTNLERPGYKALAEAVASGQVNVVVVTYLSRLARGDAFSSASYHFKQVGAHIVSVEERYTDDAAGEMALKAQTFVDGLYVTQISRFTKTKQSAMVAMGYWTGGVVPFGYVAEPVAGERPGRNGSPPKRPVIVPDDAKHVARAFETFVTSRSIAEVQRYLQAETTESWSSDRVKRLLTCETYRGVLSYGVNRNETAHEAIISAELWEAAQSTMGQRATGAAARAAGYSKVERKDTTPYYLRGLVKCAHCGGLMTPANAGKDGKPFPYYTCTKGGFVSKGGVECPVKRVNAGRLHQGVLDEIARVTAHPTRLDIYLREAVRLLSDASGLKAEAEKIKRKEKEKAQQAARLVEVLAKSKTASHTVLAHITALEADATALAVQLAEVQARVMASTAKRPDTNALRALWGEFGDNWAYLGEAERTELMQLLVSKVMVDDKEKGTLHLFLQCPPSTVWSFDLISVPTPTLSLTIHASLY